MHDAPSFPRRRIAGAVAATLAAFAVAAPADSIAYIKGGNVYLSTTDGARSYQVTSDGGYSTVSQADSGSRRPTRAGWSPCAATGSATSSAMAA